MNRHKAQYMIAQHTSSLGVLATQTSKLMQTWLRKQQKSLFSEGMKSSLKNTKRYIGMEGDDIEDAVCIC